VVSVAFSPDGRHIAIGSDLGYLQLWDVAAGGITATYNMAGQGVGGGAASIAFGPDGTTLAAGTDDGDCNGVVQFWKLPDGKSTYHSVNGADCRGDAGITTVVFRGKGTVISGGVDGAIRVWDVSSGKNTATWSAGGPVAALALSPDGKMLVSGGQAADGGLVRFWDLPSGTSRHAASKGRILSIAWSPDGKHVVSGGQDEMVRVWDVATCTNTSSFAVPCTYGVASVAFQPDSTTYVVSGAVGAGAMIWVKQLV
jgi:WD40 repeat protein